MSASGSTDLNAPLLITVPLFRLLTLPLGSDRRSLAKEGLTRLAVKRGDSAAKDLPLTDSVCSRSIRHILNLVLPLRYITLRIDGRKAASILRVQEHVCGAQSRLRSYT